MYYTRRLMHSILLLDDKVGSICNQCLTKREDTKTLSKMRLATNNNEKAKMNLLLLSF